MGFFGELSQLVGNVIVVSPISYKDFEVMFLELAGDNVSVLP